jgi:hypothetical protein
VEHRLKRLRQSALVLAIALAAVVAGLLSPLPVLGTTLAKADDPVCSKFMIVGVRGSGQPYNGPYGMGTTAGVAVDEAAKMLVDSYGYSQGDISRTTLGYPAAEAGVYTHFSGEWWDSVTSGVNALDDLISGTVSRCPETRIGLVGFSQGAGVVNATLRQLHSTKPHLASHVRAALLIADPFRDGNQRYAHDITATGSVVAAKGYSGALRRWSVPEPYRWITRDICQRGDGVCEGVHQNLSESAVRVALTTDTHGSYARCCGGGVLREYGQQVAWLLTHRPSGGGGGGGGGGSTPDPVKVTVSRFSFSNGAGVIFAKDGRDSSWATLNPDGRAAAYQTSGDRIGAILDGNLFIKDGLYDTWHKLTEGADVKSFRMEGSRIAFMNSAGVIFAKDGRDSSWATLNPDGRAGDFVLEGNWIGAILDGSYYVKEGLHGNWVTMAGGGDANKIDIYNSLYTL